jgi:Scavenger receptor cysteine-rich domain
MHAGCASQSAEPKEGDVRLVPIANTTATQPCDNVHYGAAELYHNGQWGRLCDGAMQVTLPTASVICRQLGFEYGTSYQLRCDVQKAMLPCKHREMTLPSSMCRQPFLGADYDWSNPYDGSEQHNLVWATQYTCLGTEEKLLDCVLPEDFGASSNQDDQYQDYQASNSAVEEAPSEAPGPAPEGIREDCSLDDSRRLAVVCRNFRVEGTVPKQKPAFLAFLGKLWCPCWPTSQCTSNAS